MKPPKPKSCIICKNDFKPFLSTQKVCGIECSITYSKSQAIKHDKAEKKEWGKRKREGKESLKTVQDYVQEVQALHNQWVNIRDKGLPCISCDKPYQEGDINASHYYSVGHYPELRFEEDNTHSSCIRCNQHLRGNLLEYRPRLIAKIGQERFDDLESKKGKPVQYRIPELMAMKAVYLKKIKALKASGV